MQVNLIFYAVLQETISEDPLLLEVKNGCTAEQVLELLAEKFPQAAPILKSTRLANEDEYVGKQTTNRRRRILFDTSCQWRIVS